MMGLTAFHAPAAEPKAELRDFAIRTWTKADGLPDAPVSVIVQTRDGYLWIGTAVGLFRFDGVNFNKIPLSAQGTNSVVPVTALCEDNAGGLWIGSQDAGLYLWRNGQARHFGRREGLIDLSITSLTLDKDGHIWLGSHAGAASYDGARFSAYTVVDGLPSNLVSSVQAAPSGTVWITTLGGISRFINHHLGRFRFPEGDQEGDQEFLQVYEDRRGNLWAFRGTYLINLAEGRRINYFPGEKSAKTRIWSLCEGSGGRLWIGASGRGVFCFDGTKFQPVTLNEGRWPNDVRTICEDHEGNLWLGISDIGLVQLRPQSFALLTETQGLPPDPVTCVTTDLSGRLYVGMDSRGIYAYRGDHFAPIDAGDAFLQQAHINCLCATPDGSLWAGTTGIGLYQINDGHSVAYTTADGLGDDGVPALCAGERNSVWSGTRFGAVQQFVDGHFITYTQADGLPGAPITAMLSASRGGVWIGTSNGVLIHAGEGFKDVSVVPLPIQLAGKAILGLSRAAGGGLWIGTDGGGLGYLNASTRRAWDSHDGLPDDIVWSMAEDEESNLWLVTTKGLSRVSSVSVAQALAGNGSLKTSMVYETDPANLKTFGSSGPRAIRDENGRIWVASGGGLVGVDIQGRETDKPAPQVHIEAVIVNNNPLVFSLTNAVRFPASQRSLEFRFSALSFENPEKVRFRHRLAGFDAAWVEGGSERQVRYGPLPGGEYNFHVTACNAEGVWNETGASLAFVIPTPYWREPWVLGLATLTATMLGAGGVAPGFASPAALAIARPGTATGHGARAHSHRPKHAR